jgi:hypothetical protein
MDFGLHVAPIPKRLTERRVSKDCGSARSDKLPGAAAHDFSWRITAPF